MQRIANPYNLIRVEWVRLPHPPPYAGVAQWQSGGLQNRDSEGSIPSTGAKFRMQMKYVVAGKLVNFPTPDQEERVRFTGGWQERTINSLQVQWNACVSPGFATGENYKF